MRLSKKTVVPLLILGVGVLGVAVIVSQRPRTTPEAPPPRLPVVRVQTVEPAPVDFVVTAHGTVAPRREGDLVPQVTGAVVWVSSALASGGFFDAGEPLLRIDRAEYEVGLESARANVARAESEADRASTAFDRQKRLADSSVSSESSYDDARNRDRVAVAALREARAKLALAERDLEHTEIKAPYTGRVRRAGVDVGQFVTRGTSIGKIYSVDFAEVRLPIPDSELDYLDLELDAADSESERGPSVTLSARFARGEYTWEGRVVRTEGEIDAQSRMVNLVVQVADPYRREAGSEGARPPLAVGLFVEAEIAGRRVDDVVVLPRVAVRDDQSVIVVDTQTGLQRRAVDVLRLDADSAFVGGGLAPGERVVVSPLRTFVEGMQVRVLDDDTGALPAVTPAAAAAPRDALPSTGGRTS